MIRRPPRSTRTDTLFPYTTLFRSLSRRLGAGLEVDDVVQEAYAVLVELPDVAHIREPRAYLFTTARSVVLQHVRRSRIVALEAVAEIDRPDIEHAERSPARHGLAGPELRPIRERESSGEGKR